MIKKCYFTLVLTLASCLCIASSTTPLAIAPTPNVELCDLPAPNNFKVEDHAPNWVRLFWGPINPGGPQHRVRTYLTNGNILVNNVVVAANLDKLVVNNLIPGELYYSRINAICSDGTDSKYFKDITHPDGFITELITMGYSDPGGNASCGVNESDEYCEFSVSNSSDNYFRFRKSNYPSLYRKFAIYKDDTDSHLMAKVDPADDSGLFQFKIDDKEPDDDGVGGLHFQVYSNGTMLAAFQLYNHYSGGPTVGHLICESMTTSYEIVRLSPPPSIQRPPSTIQASVADRDEKAPAPLVFAATPNPFSNALDLMLSQPVQTEATLQLLNLSGQTLLNQSLAIGQKQHTLSTEHLPIGFYFLRIEQDGEVQTLKVVKSE
ncbi:MAG: T9SS type A sorting domain-containing protein [Phycisphaerae bacterium]|nr:T9SS type A sorting domain-containing protein [Saprospiraceae bacterium]